MYYLSILKKKIIWMLFANNYECQFQRSYPVYILKSSNSGYRHMYSIYDTDRAYKKLMGTSLSIAKLLLLFVNFIHIANILTTFVHTQQQGELF